MYAAMPEANQKTAFAFAGGGSLGAVQVGMLRELVRSGFTPGFVVGSSVGAINASYFAGAPNAAGVEKLADIWRGLRRREVFPVTLRSMLGFIGGQDNLIDPSALRRLTERHVPFPNLEHAPIPVHVMAAKSRRICRMSFVGSSRRSDTCKRRNPSRVAAGSHRRCLPHRRCRRKQHANPRSGQAGRYAHRRTPDRICLRPT